MGTLTGAVPRLAEHCPHKLPTSCRLTSTPLCCACADLRAHSATYSVYVDGIGFVQRGTRWQGYCWYCKEFWNNRVAATSPPIPTTQSRIPEVPDQTQFLNAWFEFHRGYKTEVDGDGTLRRIPLEFEPWIEVDPGYLPRLLSEIQRGQQPNRGIFHSDTAATANPSNGDNAPEQTVEDAIDELLNELSDDESPEPTVSVAPVSPAPAQRDANTAHGRRRRMDLNERMTRIWGTREEIASEDYQSPIGGMFARAWQRYQAAQNADTSQPAQPQTPDPQTESHPAQRRRRARERRRGVLARTARIRLANEVIDILRSNVAELGVEMHVMEQILSSPEDPDDDTFSRWRQSLFEVDQELLARLRRVRGEDSLSTEGLAVRSGYRSLCEYIDGAELESSTDDINILEPSASEDTTAGADRPNREPDAIQVSTATAEPSAANRTAFADFTIQGLGPEDANPLEEGFNPIDRLRFFQESLRGIEAAIRADRESRRANPAEQPKGLDNDEARPPAKADDQMTVKLNCQICYTQLADQAVLPCGHMCMCQYCADIHMPTLTHATTTPQRHSKCPVCRKKATSRVKIHY